MGFRFPLETVLRVRESLEKREEAALQQILAEMARVRRSMDEQEQRILSLYKQKEEAMRRPTEAFRLQSMIAEAAAAVEQRALLTQTLAGLEQQRQERLTAYQNAHRNRQMLTDMRTRQRDEWQEKLARAQQKFLDDIFAARSQRR